jgi:hypothetical protein
MHPVVLVLAGMSASVLNVPEHTFTIIPTQNGAIVFEAGMM